ncbi:hypothetical protein FRC09_019263, partial [Ceratobasidium sp. 395]
MEAGVSVLNILHPNFADVDFQVVTFLLTERNANLDTVGYVASGFWGGLAVGRLCLGQASPCIGIKREKHLVHVYI